jgi:hypothetical protein
MSKLVPQSLSNSFIPTYIMCEVFGEILSELKLTWHLSSYLLTEVSGYQSLLHREIRLLVVSSHKIFLSKQKSISFHNAKANRSSGFLKIKTWTNVDVRTKSTQSGIAS